MTIAQIAVWTIGLTSAGIFAWAAFNLWRGARDLWHDSGDDYGIMQRYAFELSKKDAKIEELATKLAELQRRASSCDLIDPWRPKDELGAALAFEMADSPYQAEMGWQKVHWELHVVAEAYRDLVLRYIRLGGVMDAHKVWWTKQQYAERP